MNLEEIRAHLRTLPRTRLASLPTPLRPAPRLRAALGPETPDLLLKLDEETGFALGGNKLRKLEFELAPPRIEGITHLITTGGPQSNHARVTAAAAARLGLGCVLIIDGAPPEPPTANALLQRLFGARIRSVDSRAERAGAMHEAATEIERAGGRALVIPLGASTPEGALGYVAAALEFDDQLPPQADRAVHLFVASSSGGTLAGLLAGCALLERTDINLVAVSADTPREVLESTAREIAAASLEVLGCDPGVIDRMEGRLDATDEEVGAGYGIPTEASREATELLALSEGVLVDPVYTSKAAAGMLGWIRAGRFPTGDRVVFWHTGGHPALFA
jgi:1-aminocyclopropane-1-carboxylate deaminase/D-cysteine desulfhydrase-like pyridoxal-dependent ACC family enzyme